MGGHPIAGSELKGIVHAREDLFLGRVCVLTPTENTAAADVEKLTDLWTTLGSRVETMTPEVHDRALAAISHLPHVIAAALAASTPLGDIPLAAGGWLDTTRIAGGDVRSGSRFFWPIANMYWRRSTSSKQNWPLCARRSRRAMPTIWRNFWLKRKRCAMLWEVDIYPLAGQPDRAAHGVPAQAAQLGIAPI